MSKPRDHVRRSKSSPGMGLLPAMANCDCHVCRPDDSYDVMDQRVLDTVMQHGWQVTLVGPGEGPDEPSFAYTVGLVHRAGHPELLMSGLPGTVMHRALNQVAARVLGGLCLSPGAAVEGALPRVPLLCEEITPAALDETVLWSTWFHRRPVGGLQLVWPDGLGRFAWQPGAAADLDERQPPEWRLATARTGAFAPDPLWPLPIPAETSVIVCTHVAERGEAINCVTRTAGQDGDEDWTFHCGRDHVWSMKNAVAWHASHVVRAAPSLRAGVALAIGEYAWRAGADRAWSRGRLEL